MRRLVRHLLVYVMAVAFATSGLAWRHCAAAKIAAPAPIAAQSAGDTAAHHDHAAAHSHHGDHAVEHQPAAADPVPPATDDHACVKCCSICTVAGALPPHVDEAIFALSSIEFCGKSDNRVGSTIRIDPGIPKRIA